MQGILPVYPIYYNNIKLEMQQWLKPRTTGAKAAGAG